MIRIVKAVIYKNDNYLLQLRDNKSTIASPNTWGFFGGGVENYESHEDALIRELKEELDWTPKEIILIHTDTKLKTKWFSVLCHVHNRELTLLEGQDMKWFKSNEIFELPNTPHIVDFIIEKHEHILSKSKNQCDFLTN